AAGAARAGERVGRGRRGRQVEIARVVDVERDDLRCAAALHLEGVEPVAAADVQAARAAQVGPGQPPEHRPVVELPGRHDPAGQLERVVPAQRLDAHPAGDGNGSCPSPGAGAYATLPAVTGPTTM